MLREDGGKSSETLGGFDVSDDTDNNHGRGFDNGDGVDDLTLVHEGTGSVNSTNNVGHTGLVSTECGQVGGITGVVMGEGPNLTGVLLGSLLGQETQTSLSGCFEFSVRHRGGGFGWKS